MNESDAIAEYIDLKLKQAGRGEVENKTVDIANVKA